MMKSQEKRKEVCRVQPIVNGPLKLILTQNSSESNTMPYNYGYASNIMFLCSKLR